MLETGVRRALGPPSGEEGEGTAGGDPEFPNPTSPGVCSDQEALFLSLIRSAFSSGHLTNTCE